MDGRQAQAQRTGADGAAIRGALTWHAETLVEPGCPTYNGDGAGTEDAYCPGGDPLCPSWGSDAPQGHFGGSGWIPAICEQRSLKAKCPICFGVDHDGSLGKVAAVKFAQEVRCGGWMYRARGRHENSIWRGTSAMAACHLRQRRSLTAFSSNSSSLWTYTLPQTVSGPHGRAMCSCFNPCDLP